MKLKTNSQAKCEGCMDDFYNGKNPMGVVRCWHLGTAETVQRMRIPVDLQPPYLHIKPIAVYACRREKGSVLVRPEALDRLGYWRSF